MKIENEVRVQQRLQHPNIVQIFEYIDIDGLKAIIMEHVDGDELYTRLDRRQAALPEAECKMLVYQLCQALLYCHDEGVVHRDVKLENILIEKGSSRLKLCDFGLATNMQKDLLKDYCGSIYYTAPEILKFCPYDGRKSDTWSAGVVMFAMITGYLPFTGDNESCASMEDVDRATKIRVLEGIFHIPENVSPEARDLLGKILVPASARISLGAILTHPWLQKVELHMSIGHDEAALEMVVKKLVQAGFDESRLRRAVKDRIPCPINGLIKCLLFKKTCIYPHSPVNSKL